MGRQANICVVDDENVVADVLCQGLKAHDFGTHNASSGQKALEICKNEDIDLILLDILMPEMSGYEVCEKLKSDPETKDITVIFVTGKGAPEDHEKGFELGAVDYITKPFNLPMVMIRVEAALSMKHRNDPDVLNMEMLQNTVYTDQLTGLRNQRYLMERLQEDLEKSGRYDFPVSCVILDVDTIHAQNDEVGAVQIDDLLPEIAMEIRSFTRSYDVLARFDGTLFVAVLPHTGLQNAMEYGDKIMRDIDATTFSDPKYPTKVAVSVGIVTVQKGFLSNAELMFGETMKTLLQAKSQPRPNRIMGNEVAPG
jgi:diguanylate cyclase (GGDEF)-like protein